MNGCSEIELLLTLFYYIDRVITDTDTRLLFVYDSLNRILCTCLFFEIEHLVIASNFNIKQNTLNILSEIDTQ